MHKYISKGTYDHGAFQAAARVHVPIGHNVRVGAVVGVSEPVGLGLDS